MSAVPPMTSATAPLKTIATVTAAPTGNKYLTLGSQKFYLEEHPPKLAFPSEQRLAVHDLIGGSRIVQPLGLVLNDVTWEGDLFGKEAEARSIAFEQMMASGQQQLLKWLTRRLMVVVKSFSAEYNHANWVRYSITVVVVSDVANRYISAMAQGINAKTSALASNASGNVSSLLAADPNGAAALAAMTYPTLNSIPSPVGQSTGNTSSFLQTIGTNIAAAQTYLSKVMSQISAAEAPVLSTISQTGSDISAASNLVTYTEAQFVQASQLVYNLQLIANNVRTGEAPTTVLLQAGTSLEEISSRYYGTTAYASQLGSANGLVSNIVRAGTTIKIFPFTKVAVGAMSFGANSRGSAIL